MNKKILFLFFIFLLIPTFYLAVLQSESIKIFAVTEDQRGIAADLILYTIPGNGDVAFVTSSSLVGKDTQTTGNIAVRIAENISKVSAKNHNFIFDIKANASEVDGPSAGAAMALLSYAVLLEKRLNNKVAITGSINSDGSIGSVGGVGPKAVAASKVGVELFMIPRGTANQPMKGDDGRTTFFNLLSYGPEELGMKVVEVDNINEAIELAYSNIENILVDPDEASLAFVPSAVKYPEILNPMNKISHLYIERAKKTISDAKKELEVTELDDNLRNSFYTQIGISERNIEMAQIYLDQNYLYSAANYSFNARVLAGAIGSISENPSLLSKNSRVLDLKINSLKREISELESQMDFFPMNNYEWLIGSQQRIAYAKNALNNIQNSRLELISLDDSVDESGIMFNIVYEFESAKAWIEVAQDFFIESKKDSVKKNVFYDEQFIIKTLEKINDLELLIIDSNLSETQLNDPIRRFNSAKISFENGFYFAALYDTFFAKSFINSEISKNDLNIDKIFEKTNENISKRNSLTSIWSYMFLDHAFFYLENAKFQLDSQRQLSYESNIKTSYDLSELSQKNIKTSYDLSELSQNIEKVKFLVDDYLTSIELDDYVGINDEFAVGISYTTKEVISPVFISIILFLFSLLLVVLFVGFNRSQNVFNLDASRADKLDLLLQRLDKALLSKKISDAEYFFLKKKYEDEFRQVADQRSKRSQIVLNLGESRSKLNALQKGLKDLSKHYKAGLVIPEDYERYILEVQTEIHDVKSKINAYEDELKFSRRRNYKRISEEKFDNALEKSTKLKGTSDIEIDEKALEKEEKIRRKKILEKFKESKNKKIKKKSKKN